MTKLRKKNLRKIFFKNKFLIYYDNFKKNIFFNNIKNEKFILYSDEYFMNIFRVCINKKQFLFSLLTKSFNFSQQFSTGFLISELIKKFKFFKKSIKCIYLLITKLKTINSDFFKKLYMFEILNFSKKTNNFLKRFIQDTPNIKIKYLLLKKSYKYTTKPKKRIKRKIIRLIGKI